MTQAGTDRVRTMAKDALAEQETQLAAISLCLMAWGHAPAEGPPQPPAGRRAGNLTASQLDRDFSDLITTHALVSLRSARVEMVGGANRAVRLIATQAIHDHDRRLSSLRRTERTGFRDTSLTAARSVAR